MTPEQLVNALQTTVVDDNNVIYRELFTTLSASTAKDHYWRDALVFFGGLSKDQQEIFFDILRQVAVDTTSNLLGVFDGSTNLDSMGANMVLLHGTEKINGDLQSLFLAAEEKRCRSV